MSGALDIKQEYSHAADFSTVVDRNSHNISRDFIWAKHLIDRKVYLPKFEAYQKTCDLPLSMETIDNIYTSSAEISSQVFDLQYPPLESQIPIPNDWVPSSPPYHNKDHALITGMVGYEQIMGGLSLLKQANPDMAILSDPTILPKLLHTFCIAACCHEVDDWWAKNCPGDGSDTNPNTPKTKEVLAQKLKELGLSSHDFNLFITLDNFAKRQEVSLREALELKPENGFLPDNGIPSILEDTNIVSAKDKRKILIFSSFALGSADFLQTINPAFLQHVNFTAPDGAVHQGHVGQFALADEMYWMRQSALDPPKWRNLDGTINHKNIAIDPPFFHLISSPRITTGLYLLHRFNANEADNARKVLASEKEALEKATSPLA